MKTLIITLVMAFATIFAQAQTNATQQSIENALELCFKNSNTTALNENYTTLEQQEFSSNWQAYWLGLNKFYEAIYLQKTSDTKAAKQAITEAERILQTIEQKNSEDYALLAYVVSFSMQFKTNGIDIMESDADFNSYINEAIQLNPNNPRPLTVAGIYDFHKPREYGGGRIAKKYLLKAQELYKQTTEANQPTWGVTENEMYLNKFEQ